MEHNLKYVTKTRMTLVRIARFIDKGNLETGNQNTGAAESETLHLYRSQIFRLISSPPERDSLLPFELFRNIVFPLAFHHCFHAS